MLSARRHGHGAGVTLVESMIVLAVCAAVLALGAPAFGDWVRDLEVRNSASALLAALQTARAEAVARNADVRLALSDTQGRAGWQLSCVRATAQCPATLRQQPVSASGRARWGASTLAAMPAFGTALDAGAGLPGTVRFDAVGAAPAVAGGIDVARIDVTHADHPAARRLVVLVAAQGMVSMCDPGAAVGRPERCR